MNLFDFMSARPFLTFCLALIIAGMVNSVFYFARQPIRAYNIRNHGWPPAHLDADGDYKADQLVKAQAKVAKDAAEQEWKRK